MAIRIPWDCYEVALLFSAYEQVADGADYCAAAVRLSVTLRALANRRGVSIDETYRNVNGIKMQLANVQYLFTDGILESYKNSTVSTQFHHLLRHQMKPSCTAPTHTDSVTQKLSQEGMFITGKSAMTIGPWIVRSIKDRDNYPHDFKTAFAPYPTIDGVRTYTQGGYKATQTVLRELKESKPLQSDRKQTDTIDRREKILYF